MPNCTNCSAPLPINAIKCDYCGSRNDVDLTGVHYYTTHECGAERSCPVCAIPLKTIDLGVDGAFFIERCSECLGLFFDPGELEALLDYTVRNVFVINRSKLSNLVLSKEGGSRTAVYVKCPVCTTIMNRINFGTRSGVVIDRCKEHGVWLDAGELRQLSEWMKAGGRLLHQEREDERQKEAQLAAEKKRRAGTDIGMTGNGTGVEPFDLKVGTDPDVFDVIFRAIRFLTSK